MTRKQRLLLAAATAMPVLTAAAGTGLVIYGLFMIYVPAAYIFAGGVLWAGAVRFARQEKADARKTG